MAKEKLTTTINDVVYELKTVHQLKKMGGQDLGKVPVRMFGDAPEFRQFIENANDGEVELVISDYRYGLGVRLQKMARHTASGESFNAAAMNKIYNVLTKDEILEFHGDHAGLVAFCRQKYEDERADSGDEYGEDYLWNVLL